MVSKLEEYYYFIVIIVIVTVNNLNFFRHICINIVVVEVKGFKLFTITTMTATNIRKLLFITP